ncbi:hypothetical protein [Gayadomonas joobiniege]|uniref:hypothetical protein n=1 Tax=Gayadomonas joobiniege TaxID=1234606 RepID=UPI00037E4A2A|nr:hypothetical protein [Gayadomonas joobiniege]
MQNLVESIRENLAQAHRRALDCDAYLDALKEQGHGQFSCIFKEGFNVQADRFMPYVEDVAKDFYEVTQLRQAQLENLDQQKLSSIVARLELIFTTQAQFLEVIQAESNQAGEL